MALAPCHCLFQTHVANGRLSLQLYQRSADIFLGVPFNIASYALLTHMLAQQCGLEVGEFIWTGGDCHLYTNHLDQARLQLTRQPGPLPRLEIRRTPPAIDQYEYEDFVLHDYSAQPHIKAASPYDHLPPRARRQWRHRPRRAASLAAARRSEALQGADDGPRDGDGAQDVRKLPVALAGPPPHRPDPRPAWTAEGAEVAHTPAAALALAGDDVAVIGGAEVFALFLPQADRIELTEVHGDYSGDATVPPFDGWREVAREDHPAEGDRPRTAS